MDIIICGNGDVGSHAAEVLAVAGHSITVIDIEPDRLRAAEEAMDVRTLVGNCAQASVLLEAGVEGSDMVVAATDADEVNLLSASLAKAMGAKKCIARVHRSAYFEQRGWDYQKQFNIDRLICPEYSTALSIARKLRNPVAMAIEDFARGAVEMQEFKVSPNASAVGKSLVDIRMPSGSRLAAITRKGGTFIPDAGTSIERDDTVILVGNAKIFPDARRQFHDTAFGRQSVVLRGGGSMSVWLSRALRQRTFSIKLFVSDRARAEELAEKLDWVTVFNADPTDRHVFAEENLGQADVFVSLLDNDEGNIISGVLAKTRGVSKVITVVQKTHYLDVVFDIGVDHVFSPRMVAAEEIDAVLDESPLRYLSSLAEGFVDLFQVRVGEKASAIGQPLRDIKLTPDWVIAAIQSGHDARVPGADDVIRAGDVILAVGRHGKHSTLRKVFAAR